MKLSDYLTGNGLSPSAFAQSIGAPPSTITRILRGERQPGLPLMARIREATSGAVTADDFLPPLTPTVPEAAE